MSEIEYNSLAERAKSDRPRPGGVNVHYLIGELNTALDNLDKVTVLLGERLSFVLGPQFDGGASEGEAESTAKMSELGSQIETARQHVYFVIARITTLMDRLEV